MKMINTIVGTFAIKMNIELSFWQAVKLRIAGKGVQPLVEKILVEIKDKIESTK